jgi:hypothetical protein
MGTCLTYVLRVWLPDRPGALGAVTSRIGAVGGDVVAIDILERGAGRAVDELVIEFREVTSGEDERRATGVSRLLLAEVGEVDGVVVEHLVPVDESHRDPRLDALDTAAVLVGAHTSAEAVTALCERAVSMLGAEWGLALSLDDEEVVASTGESPPLPWLLAFVEGSQSSARVANGDTGPDDVVWAPMPLAGMALVLGRPDSPFRGRERKQASALARIVDTRFRQLKVDESRSSHPSLRMRH